MLEVHGVRQASKDFGRNPQRSQAGGDIIGEGHIAFTNLNTYKGSH